jgi:ankyrin repeat protein
VSSGRQDIVTLLLQHHADVNLLNAEGNSPRQVARTVDIQKFIEAAEITEKMKTEERFRKAARDGQIETLTSLLKSNHPLNINCVDTYGNSALHLASTRGRKEVVVLLLQNGVDTSIRNS